MTPHGSGTARWADKSHLFRGMRVNRKALWKGQAVEISVSHDELKHTSRTWTMAMDDATNVVLVATIVALLAKEIEDEIMVYSRLEGAK